MTDQSEQSLVIQMNDPAVARHPHLDFQFLRQKGLEHIGELSGKIWTDHNTHDPGITILEVLCYALVDLGYRAAAPIEDLVAPPPDQSGASAEFRRNDNFFTPLEILSCNPATILDYRKLLFEVPGVRNAWVEPISPKRGSAGALYVEAKGRGERGPFELSCRAERKDTPTVALNGLYRILIEREEGADNDTIFKETRKILSAHRNLCEDFQEIVILSPLAVGICADVEIEAQAKPAAVYQEIIQAIYSYITPQIRHYTLGQLLNKGRAIEEVLAGRPFLERSVGFVDTEELKNAPLRKELNASDLYAAIGNVQGVASIRALSFRTDISRAPKDENIDRLTVAELSVAVFSLERTCIQLRVGNNLVALDKEALNRGQLAAGKSAFDRRSLDLEILEGRYSLELTEYQSIQEDFPRVYSIGQNELSADAPPLRKAQAVQLQGYLLFYDQLLANYLAQLANVRNVFSLRRESARQAGERRTYFNHALENMAALNELQLARHPKAPPANCLIAAPVSNKDFAAKLAELRKDPNAELLIEENCEPAAGALPHRAERTAALLEASIHQCIRDTGQGDFEVTIHKDGRGYFFVFGFTEMADAVLVGTARHETERAARDTAHFASFLAGCLEHFRRGSRKDSKGRVQYFFDLVFNANAQVKYLQDLLEQPELYLQRRQAFLDHLLARFAHQFTDYALLQFKSSGDAASRWQEKAVEDKSRFLSEFAEISRNRGRAFDYQKRSWGTNNVSGLEARVSLMAGTDGWTRRRVCKLEVAPTYRVEVADLEGKPWFQSKASYISTEEASAAAKQLQEKLRRPESYPDLAREFTSFDQEAARWLFSDAAGEENIEASGHAYGLELRDLKGKVRARSARQDYAGEEQAWQDLPTLFSEAKKSGLELQSIAPDKRVYIDTSKLRWSLERLTEFRWHLYDATGGEVGTGEKPFATKEEAIAGFAQGGDWRRFITHEKDFGWRLMDRRGEVLLQSASGYPDVGSAITAMLESLAAARIDKNYKSEGNSKTGYRVLLREGKGPAHGAMPGTIPDAKARDAALKKIRKEAKELISPFEVKEKAPRYRWQLRRAEGDTLVAEGSEWFGSEAEVGTDFANSLERIGARPELSEVSDNTHTVGLSSLGLCRFVYWTRGADGPAVPLLRSREQFSSRDQAKEAYGAFTRELSSAERKGNEVIEGGRPVASLTSDKDEDRTRTDQIIDHLKRSRDNPQAGVKPARRWIYRLVDQDHPVARSPQIYENLQTAQAGLPEACGFSPFKIERCGPPAVRIVRPAKDPDRYHYWIHLRDDQGEEHAFLVSYLGYPTCEAASAAAEDQWLRLIELATDPAHYGAGQPIGLDETYSSGSDVCLEGQSHLAVVPKEFRDKLGGLAVRKAVELASRYPVRISYKRDISGNPTREQAGYRFQGFDLKLPKVIWRSARVYPTPHEALEDYRRFTTTLRNPRSCRIVCENGKYRIVLVEILAESVRDFDTAEDAWGASKIDKDSCDRRVCIHTGARLFAEASSVKEAYITKREGNCHGFDVVSEDYHVARHTCWYDSPEQRDRAAALLRAFAATPRNETYSQRTTDQGLRYDLGQGYYFLSKGPVPESSKAGLLDKWFYLASAKANYPENGRELRDPFDHNRVLASLEREGAGFDLAEFLGLVRAYPVFKKKNLYYFRLYYPENNSALDETFDTVPCGCDPAASAKPAEKEFCGRPYILESVRGYPCRRAAELAFESALPLFKDPANYDESSESGLGRYSFTIVNPEEVLATHPNCHPDQADATRAIERAHSCANDEGMHLLEHILLRPQPPNEESACCCLLPVCPDMACKLTWSDHDEDDECARWQKAPEYIPGTDPYSFWATVVLPAWTPRFRSLDRREAFRQMLHREAPAMVGLNILWLDPRQMCRFDEAFRAWLDWRRSPALMCDQKADPVCDLVSCFKELKDEPPCPNTGPFPAECDCLKDLEEEKKCPQERDDQLFWAKCDSEPPSPETPARPEPPLEDSDLGVSVRLAQANRTGQFIRNIEAAADKKTRDSARYKRAVHFLNNPTLDGYAPLISEWVGREQDAAGKAILSNATWRLMDVFAQQQSGRAPEEIRALLLNALGVMKENGVDPKEIVNAWPEDPLLRRISPSLEIRKLLEET
jgi:hypothetical protein